MAAGEGGGGWGKALQPRAHARPLLRRRCCHRCRHPAASATEQLGAGRPASGCSRPAHPSCRCARSRGPAGHRGWGLSAASRWTAAPAGSTQRGDATGRCQQAAAGLGTPAGVAAAAVHARRKLPAAHGRGLRCPSTSRRRRCSENTTSASPAARAAAAQPPLSTHGRTLEMVSAGDHCSLRMSRQMLPWLLMLGWYTCGRAGGRRGAVRVSDVPAAWLRHAVPAAARCWAGLLRLTPHAAPTRGSSACTQKHKQHSHTHTHAL